MKKLFIGISIVMVIAGCAGSDALSWRDPAHSIELMDRTEVYSGQDVKKRGRIYKGLYSKLLHDNKFNAQYKVIANRREQLPSDIQLSNGDKRLIVTGVFQILHKTGKSQICDNAGCSSNPNEYTKLNYANLFLKIKLCVYDIKKNNKQIIDMNQEYHYGSTSARGYGNLMVIPLITNKSIYLNKKGAGIHVSPNTWYSIRVEYHDPENKGGSFIKGWSYTVNKPNKPFEEVFVATKKSNITWWDNEAVAVEEALKSKKPIHVFITNDENCRYCDMTEKELFNNARVTNILNEFFISVKIDIDDSAAKKYKVQGIPSHYFKKYDGKHIGHTAGVNPAEKFIKILKQVIEMNGRN